MRRPGSPSATRTRTRRRSARRPPRFSGFRRAVTLPLTRTCLAHSSRGNRRVGAFDLKGRVAVVTGGNGGIGLGMARGLAEAGAAVVVAARNREKSAKAVAELRDLGAQAEAIEVNVDDEASVEALVKATLTRFGRLDVLVTTRASTSESRRRASLSRSGTRSSRPTSPALFYPAGPAIPS